LTSFGGRKNPAADKWHLNRFTFYLHYLAQFPRPAFERSPLVRDEIVDKILAAANSDGSIGDNALERPWQYAHCSMGIA